jgi:hypothetical protein
MLLPRLWHIVLATLFLAGVLPPGAAAQTDVVPVYRLTHAAGTVDSTISARMLFAFKREGRFTDCTG